MAVSVTDPVAGPFYPNGTTTIFPFAFKVMSPSEIAVVDGDGLPISGLGYSVTLNDDEGGSVIFPVAPASDALPSFFIASDPDFQQLTQYGSVGTFNPRTLNGPLDRQAVATLALRARLLRSVVLPFDPTSVVGKFPVVLADGSQGWSSGTGADLGLRTDLAEDGGAALVKASDGNTVQDNLDHGGWFTQAGTGAVSRTSQAKSRDTLSIMDFGAVADGATDDSAALQAAVTAAAAAGKALFVPKGTYLLGTRQTTYDGKKALCLIPTGVDFVLCGEGADSRFTIANNFNAGGDYSFFWSADANPHGKVEVYGIHIDGNGSNNLVADSGANARKGYGIKLIAGDEFYCHDNYFSNMAGRNIIVIAATTSPPSWRLSRIQGNSFKDMGGAIAGNENQNDHSTIYVEAVSSIISGNSLSNSNPAFNPLATPLHTVTAIEEHSEHALVYGNAISNYGYGLLSVGAIGNGAYSQVFVGNALRGMKNSGLNIFSTAPLRRVSFIGNSVEIDNSTYASGNGLYQNNQNGATTYAVEHLIVDGNTFTFTNTTSVSGGNYGILLTALVSFRIEGNYIENSQNSGILLANNTGALNIENGSIDRNTFRNCGRAIAYSIQITNPDTNKVFRNIKIGPGNVIIADPQPVGSSPLNTRGIRITGPGNLQDIVVHTPIVRGSISRTNRVALASTTLNQNVAQVPRTVMMASASSPVSGYFDNAGEVIQHTDPASAGYIGRITSTSGSAASATWAATTAYTVGQWIKTSGNKVIECRVAGTSGSTEPAPTTLGQQVSDGTVTWLYKDTVLAAFTTYGVIS